MPILEFRCKSCETVSEELVLAGDVATTPVCAKCGGQEMSRLLSTFAAGAGHAHAEAPACAASGGCANAGACGMGGGCGDDF